MEMNESLVDDAKRDALFWLERDGLYCAIVFDPEKRETDSRKDRKRKFVLREYSGRTASDLIQAALDDGFVFPNNTKELCECATYSQPKKNRTRKSILGRKLQRRGKP